MQPPLLGRPNADTLKYLAVPAVFMLTRWKTCAKLVLAQDREEPVPKDVVSALCPKCRTRMQMRGIEETGGKDDKKHSVAVFECGQCGRLKAEELTLVTDAA